MSRVVSLVRVADRSIDSAVREAVSLAGGLESLIDSSTSVLVKPNLWNARRSGSGSITNTAVTEAVTRLVLEHGARSVIIGDGAGAGYDGFSHSTEEAFDRAGLRDVASRLGVTLRNLNTDEFEEVDIPHARVMHSVRIARTALDSDVIISVPVLKSHIRTHATLSLKNTKGVIAGAEKRKTHRLGLDSAIVDLNSVVGPQFVVLDATTGMQGLWNDPDDSIEMGLVVAGAHALSVDLVGAALMQIEPSSVLHLRYQSEREGVAASLEGIHLVGESVEAHSRPFKTGFQVFNERYPQVTIISGESACTGCTSELVTALTYLDKAGYSPEMDGLRVVIGEVDAVEATPKLAVLGRCGRMHSDLGVYAPGCPPGEEEVIRALSKACGVDAARVLEVRDSVRQQMWKETEENLST
ncbi:DUF362 domain-containing protein [Chloroflexota bacterium]